ncbi:hypothetical protein [Brevibacillus sp. IT-7CA2]|uniref:hypothetical protein n=1 Tax=Brevibacillus sp. IT-7CA2 TaxID=3026436 RepID=UPI0039E1152D
MTDFDPTKSVMKGEGFFHTSSLRKWKYNPTDTGPEKVHIGNQTPFYFKYNEGTTYQDVLVTIRSWYFEAMWNLHESGHKQLATFFDIPEPILAEVECLAKADYDRLCGQW